MVLVKKSLLLSKDGGTLKGKKGMLKAHPNITKLYGHNPYSFLLIVACFTAQTALALYAASAPIYITLLLAATIGSLLSFDLSILGHEAVHGLIFSNVSANRVCSMLSFIPVFMGPFASFWMYEHMWHHNVVTDKAARYGKQSNPFIVKVLYISIFINLAQLGIALIVPILILRILLSLLVSIASGIKLTKLLPASVRVPPWNRFPQTLNWWLVLNSALCITYQSLLMCYGGRWSIAYLLLANLFANGLSPLGMRQVQEHYIKKPNQPTYSLYNGIWSWFTINAGYHTEHHDFPKIPWNKLPQLKKIAPEYYMNIAHYTSYTALLIEFLTTPGIPMEGFVENAGIFKTFSAI
jgi:sphingolipid delta-4 desaturase